MLTLTKDPIAQLLYTYIASFVSGAQNYELFSRDNYVSVRRRRIVTRHRQLIMTQSDLLLYL
jgi:hypothetical protein